MFVFACRRDDQDGSNVCRVQRKQAGPAIAQDLILKNCSVQYVSLTVRIYFAGRFIASGGGTRYRSCPIDAEERHRPRGENNDAHG